MLVGLPLRLLPGQVPKPPTVFSLSSFQQTLLLSWSILLVAAAAGAVVLRGVILLSERRGDFVSAVTHELRTPLTTFQMYTEMLAEGMVGENKRRAYLERLRTEAQRLGHLVENVLAYARLEQGRTRKQLETLRLQELFEHARERLTSHSEYHGMQLVFDADGTADVWVRTDRAAAEQVLFNLVDNACKYAAQAGDRRIHVEAQADAHLAGLRVRDHGRASPAPPNAACSSPSASPRPTPPTPHRA
jgi:signal transduction histidine kinase